MSILHKPNCYSIIFNCETDVEEDNSSAPKDKNGVNETLELVPGEPDSTTVTSHLKKKKTKNKNEDRKVATETSDIHNPIENSEDNKGPRRLCNSLRNTKEGSQTSMLAFIQTIRNQQTPKRPRLTSSPSESGVRSPAEKKADMEDVILGQVEKNTPN